MLGRVLAAVAAASTISLMLSGCFGPSGAGQFPPLMRPAQPPNYTSPRYIAPPSPPSVNQSYPANENPVHERAGSRANSPESTQVVPLTAPAGAAPPAKAAPPAEAAPQPTVSLTGNVADRDRALRLLNDTGARLARINRNKLGKDSAVTYDQANHFLKAGRKAALEEDYVVATGDAEKASVLANKLKAASQ